MVANRFGSQSGIPLCHHRSGKAAVLTFEYHLPFHAAVVVIPEYPFAPENRIALSFIRQSSVNLRRADFRTISKGGSTPPSLTLRPNKTNRFVIASIIGIYVPGLFAKIPPLRSERQSVIVEHDN